MLSVGQNDPREKIKGMLLPPKSGKSKVLQLR